ncbi:MAG: MBL fold metallo-hydrolase [Eubacterium sp.]|nr:MBL fold metallo-hydrolase [Eubacterium sp.]
MKLVTVIENTCGRTDCKYEHGLCIYVETEKHKLLFDTGATDAFAENAKTLGIDLQEIDTVVLSHGHYDHGGGILEFRRHNLDAPIFMQGTATGMYYNKERYIGLDKRISELSGVCFLDGDYRIDEELLLFSGIKGRRLWPQGNRTLGCVRDGIRHQDEFSHEQCLEVSCEGKRILLSGCAHNGILNILDRYKSLFGRMPDLVVSGFHMMKKTEYDDREIKEMEETAKELKNSDTLFYTGHCTGQQAYEIMHRIMGEQLRLMHSGVEIVI